MDRRQFLSAAAATGTLTLAGCLGDSEATAGETTPEQTDGGGGQSVDSHPGAADLAAQPRLGDLGGHVIVAFEDPSCPRCAAFHSGTVSAITEQLVAPGKAAFVARMYPVVYEWGGPATRALEATFDRNADAFWALYGHYFEDQSRFDTDNVLDLTEQFLAEQTAVDGAAVVADVESGAYDESVQADLDAGENAGVGRTTPTVLLFRDGQYVTRAAGSVSYDLIATALGEG